MLLIPDSSANNSTIFCSSEFEKSTTKNIQRNAGNINFQPKTFQILPLRNDILINDWINQIIISP